MFEDFPKYKVGERAYRIEILHFTITEGFIIAVAPTPAGNMYKFGLSMDDKNAELYHEDFVSNDKLELLMRYYNKNVGGLESAKWYIITARNNIRILEEKIRKIDKNFKPQGEPK